MARRSGLPSNFDLAVLIIVGYGIFITMASFGMTKRMPHFEGHYYDFYNKQSKKPRYTRIKLNKMGKVTSENSVGIMKPLPRSSNVENGRNVEETIEKSSNDAQDIESQRKDPDDASADPAATPESTSSSDTDEDQAAEPDDLSHAQSINTGSALTLKGAPTKKKPPPVPGDANRQYWYNVIKTSPIYDSIPERPLRVAMVTRDLKAGPTNHVMVDGIRNSEHLELYKICFVDNRNSCHVTADDPLVDLWLIDANGIKTKARPGDMVHQLLNVKNPHFQILFMDYSDRFVPKSGFLKNHYPDMAPEKFEQGHIRFAIRCIVKGRLFRINKMDYVNLGTLVSPDYHDMLSTKQGLPFHAPFGVRTDFANSIQDLIPSLVANQTVTKVNPSSIPFHPAYVMDRPLDVTHLWEILLPSKNNDLRNLVTEKVQGMASLQHPVENRKIVVDTSIQGDRAHKGRWGVSDAYATTLLQSKIVVVTQRDQWEDHFRLFEATASGAMALMDVMLSLPHSLQDGASVVFFHSLEDLQEKAMYYLAHEEERIEIARKGWEISMREHRSWHRMEEMLFGKGVTDTRIEDTWNPTLHKEEQEE